MGVIFADVFSSYLACSTLPTIARLTSCRSRGHASHCCPLQTCIQLLVHAQAAEVEVEYVSAPHEFDFSAIKAEPRAAASSMPAQSSEADEVEALDRIDLLKDTADDAVDADGEPMAGLGATPGLGASSKPTRAYGSDGLIAGAPMYGDVDCKPGPVHLMLVHPSCCASCWIDHFQSKRCLANISGNLVSETEGRSWSGAQSADPTLSCTAIVSMDRWQYQTGYPSTGGCACTMRFGSTAKVLLKCKLKYYRISECACAISFSTNQQHPLKDGNPTAQIEV